MKKRKIIPIKVYFQADDEAGMKVVKRVETIVKRTGLSVSAVAGLAIRYGLMKVEEALPEVKAVEGKKISK